MHVVCAVQILFDVRVLPVDIHCVEVQVVSGAQTRSLVRVGALDSYCVL